MRDIKDMVISLLILFATYVAIIGEVLWLQTILYLLLLAMVIVFPIVLVVAKYHILKKDGSFFKRGEFSIPSKKPFLVAINGRLASMATFAIIYASGLYIPLAMYSIIVVCEIYLNNTVTNIAFEIKEDELTDIKSK